MGLNVFNYNKNKNSSNNNEKEEEDDDDDDDNGDDDGDFLNEILVSMKHIKSILAYMLGLNDPAI